MNHVIKNALLTIVFLSLSNSVFAYQFIFNNKTDVDVVVTMVLATNYPWRKVIPAGKSYTYPFSNIGSGYEYMGGVCWWKIYVTEYDKNDVQKFYNELLAAGTHKESHLRQLKAWLDRPYDYDLFKYESETPLIFKYFDQRIDHVPQIFDAKSSFDYEKITELFSQLGENAEEIGKVMAKLFGSDISPDMGLSKLFEKIAGAAVENVKHGGCASRTFDIFSKEVHIPGFKNKKERAFILVNRLQ